MSIKSQPDPTCLNHTDAERIACPVCLVTALTAERDKLRAEVDRLTPLLDSAREVSRHQLYCPAALLDEAVARAERAEAVLADPQQLYAHCLRTLNEGQIAHLFGGRMTEIVNRAERAEAERATERARLDYLLQWDVTFHDRADIDKDMKR